MVDIAPVSEAFSNPGNMHPVARELTFSGKCDNAFLASLKEVRKGVSAITGKGFANERSERAMLLVLLVQNGEEVRTDATTYST